MAIGKEGQNVRLAARITGWKIDIKDSASYNSEMETDLDSADESAAITTTETDLPSETEASEVESPEPEIT